MISEKKLDTIDNVKETQKIRLWVDLLFIPALLGMIAYKGRVTKVDKVLLVSLAVVTVGYNLKNYIKTSF